MYFRYVLPVRDPRTRAEAGLFGRAYDVARDERVPDWLRDALRSELGWFDDRLAVPERLSRRFRRRGTIHGICWFRPEAGEAITRARYAAWLMTEAGVPVSEIRIDDPGERIWQDAMQVVAKPGGHVPVAFH